MLKRFPCAASEFELIIRNPQGKFGDAEYDCLFSFMPSDQLI